MSLRAHPPADPRPRSFDVLCAGDTLLHTPDRSPTPTPAPGALTAALALAHQELRVGLATVLPDDTIGRALLADVAARGIDVAGVQLATPRDGLVFVKGGARQVLSYRADERPIAIPAAWSSAVLLLSGMSPVVSHGAALCKAARAARRAGTFVVVDVNADWHLWEGRDARAICMVLREADVVSCTAQDLYGLAMDAPSLRAALRPTAVLVLSDGAGTVSATGPFGEVVHAVERTAALAAVGEGDAFNAAIGYELARAGHADEGGALWARALERAHKAVLARARRLGVAVDSRR